MSQLQHALPLDPSLYTLDEYEITFFKEQTGIHDESQLRDHIMAVQKEAYSVFPYPCIRLFGFVKSHISNHPAYFRVLQLGEDRKDAIFLELGCNMGSDVRKVIADGFPRDNVVASDLHADFWPLGHKLFKTTQETFPIAFIAGDIFDNGFLPDAPSQVSISFTAPPLHTLASLVPLQHRVSIIYTAAVFHLFDEEKQHSMAHRLGNLLSPVSGSVIFGWDLGLEDAEENKNGGKRMNSRAEWVCTHSATSWKKMWVGEGRVFKPGDVAVEVSTVAIEAPLVTRPDDKLTSGSKYVLYWSVTRV